MAVPYQGRSDASQERPVRIARLSCRYCIAPQLSAEEFFFAAGELVEQCVKTRRVVVMEGVAEFVQQHEVAQVRRKCHQKETERQIIVARAAAPFGARCADRYSPVPKSVETRQLVHTQGQFGFGGTAQCLDVVERRRGMRRSTCCEAVARSHDPVALRFQKSQRPRRRYAAGETQPHDTRAAHRERDTACAAGLAEDDFAQQGMLQRGLQRYFV